jgi:hypothetical protein
MPDLTDSDFCYTSSDNRPTLSTARPYASRLEHFQTDIVRSLEIHCQRSFIDAISYLIWRRNEFHSHCPHAFVISPKVVHKKTKVSRARPASRSISWFASRVCVLDQLYHEPCGLEGHATMSEQCDLENGVFISNLTCYVRKIVVPTGDAPKSEYLFKELHGDLEIRNGKADMVVRDYHSFIIRLMGYCVNRIHST